MEEMNVIVVESVESKQRVIVVGNGGAASHQFNEIHTDSTGTLGRLRVQLQEVFTKLLSDNRNSYNKKVKKGRKRNPY